MDMRNQHHDGVDVREDDTSLLIGLETLDNTRVGLQRCNERDDRRKPCMATYLEDALAKSVHVIDKIVVVALLIIALHDLRQTNQKARQFKDHEKEMIDRERATRKRTDWAAWRSMFITTSRYLSKLPPKKWRVRLQVFNQQFINSWNEYQWKEQYHRSTRGSAASQHDQGHGSAGEKLVRI